MAKGYILIHRKIWDNRIWKRSEPFDGRSAWLDLLLMANHADKQMIIGVKTVTIKRGEIYTSNRNLAKRWHWSINKVVRYLTLLSEQGMITVNGTPNGTRLAIVKYGFYQGSRNTNEYTHEYTDEYTNEYTYGLQTNNVINNVSKNETNNVRKKYSKRPAGDRSSSLKAWEELERRIEGNG